MRYGSVCSGIEAATVAWHPLGWEAAWFSEIEPFPCAVLKHHYPAVPNHGDMTNFQEWPDEPIDLLVGGTPCQSFSVAGLRKGLADPRGNLMLTFGAIARRYRPEWLVWENVPGVLSSNGGRDFGTFLGMLAELGYGFAYRVLDAQFFGVAQRRRRVFVVANARGWHRAAAVLFERHSLSGNPPPSREARKGVAEALGRSVAGCLNSAGGHAVSGNSIQDADQGYLIPTIAKTHCRGGQQRLDSETETLIPTIGGAFNVAHAFDARQSDVIQYGDKTGPLDTDGHSVAVMQPIGVTLHGTDGTQSVASFTDLSSSPRSRIPSGVENSTTTAVLQPVGTDCYNGAITGDVAATIGTPGSSVNASGSTVMQAIGLDEEQNACVDGFGTLKARMEGGGFEGSVMTPAMQVRRLTPVECERLQGFPDNYTNIPWRKSTESPDGPRYKALGNSMAVPVMRWIGERIQQVSDL